jgi:rubrerythrin
VKFDTKEPCKSCPYRKDAKLGLWHPCEFENLARTEEELMGAMFGCHATGKGKTPMSICAGWLLAQREQGFPSIALRLYVLQHPEVDPALDAVSDGGHDLYANVREMIDANEELGRCPECDRYLTANGDCPVCDAAESTEPLRRRTV